jgi:FkbM family methyltransferase
VIRTIKHVFSKYLPPSVFFIGRSILTLFDPRRNISVVFKWDQKFWELNPQSGKQWLQCSPVPYRWPDESQERRNRVERYTLDEFVEIQPDDLVVEVGGFTGEFTVPASQIADRIYSFEPDPITADCLRYNLRKQTHVEVVNAAAWNKTGTMKLLTGGHPSDHSLIGLDSGSVKKEVEIDSTRLDEFAEERGIKSIDFLKLDAEGGEPEVLEGTEHVDIRKMAIDCTPERNGESTAKQVSEYLSQRGYEIRSEGNLIFARQC